MPGDQPHMDGRPRPSGSQPRDFINLHGMFFFNCSKHSTPSLFIYLLFVCLFAWLNLALSGTFTLLCCKFVVFYQLINSLSGIQLFVLN